MSQHFISRADAESNFLDAAAYLAESIPAGESHGSAIATVVPQYLEKGKVDLAAELANTVDDPFTRDRLLIAVAGKCAEIDDDEYGLQLVETIEDPGFKAQGYERIGFAKADKGEFEKAGDIAAMMMHPDSVLARIAVKKAADGDVNGAMETIGEIEFPRDAVTALNTIAVASIKTETNERAIELLLAAESKAAEIEHDEERIRSYAEIGNLLIDTGDKGKAFQVYENARSDAEELGSTHRDNLLAQVAIGILHTGSVDHADRTLDSISDKTQIASVVLAFARDHWQKDEKDEAYEALEEAYAVLLSQHENETRESRAKFVVMTAVAVQFAGFEKCERAVEIADTIPDETHKTNALSQIAQLAASQGLYQIAEHAAGEIDSELDRMITTVLMGRAASNSGDTEKSAELLSGASDAIAKLSEPTMRHSAFIELSRAYFETGDQNNGILTFEKALGALMEVRNSTFQVSGLSDVSKLSGEFGLEMTDAHREMLKSVVGY